MTRHVSGLGVLGPCPVLLLLSGCGLGTVGIVSASGSGSSGGDVNSPPQLSGVLVYSEQTSPAVIQFDLRDAEEDPVSVAITFLPPGSPAGGPQAATLIPGDLQDLSGEVHLATVDLGGLSTSSAGSTYFVLWDYGQDGLGPELLEEPATLFLNIVAGGGSEQQPLEPDPEPVAVGNDPPVFLDGTGNAIRTIDYLDPELSAIAFVPVFIDDSQSDGVRITIEYLIQGEASCSEWQLARSAALPFGDPTTGGQIDTDADGEQEDFFWDTDYFESTPTLGCDLEHEDRPVVLRLTAVEELNHAGTGTTDEDEPLQTCIESVVFRVDNNSPPVAFLDGGSLLTNPDRRRGIPVHFTVLDDESDPVHVLLQWRREGQPFPDLTGATVADLIDLIENPARDGERKEKQIGRQAPPAFSGRAGFLEPPTSPDRVRLPELAGSAATLLAHVLAGKSLEILRPDAPAEVSWPTNPPVGSVAAVARKGGRRALVLDTGASGWQVREIDLTTGDALPYASGPGAPRAMCVDPSRAHLFVASDGEVFRFAYHDGTPQGSILHSLVDGPRGLAALGSDVLVATGDDKVVRLDFRPGAPPESPLVDGLAEPWGIAGDPLHSSGLYVAERGADRVLELDLDVLLPLPVVAEVRPADVPALGALPFPSPRALALEQAGQRLLVMSETADSASLRSLDLRCPIDGDDDPVAGPFVFEITDQLDQADAWLATGPDGLRIVSLSNALALGGGVEQCRSIDGDPAQAYDPETQVVAVETGFDPALSGEVPWRIPDRLELAESSPTGAGSVIVWDSTEVLGGGRVQLRILPLDDDVGVAAPVPGFKSLRWGLDVEPSSLDDSSSPQSVAAGDLDGDGDLDLVSANRDGNNLTVFFQTRRGEFDPPLVLAAPMGPQSVATGDFDGNGYLDLVSANVLDNNLSVFFQTSPGEFGCPPELLTGRIMAPQSVATGDLDGNGSLDIVSANAASQNLTIFFQTSPGVFRDPPMVLEDSRVDTPRAVAVADIDGNGSLDIVSANEGSDSLTIFFQTGPGRFPGPARVLTDRDFFHMDAPQAVAAGDLDGDGDLDLVSANLYSQTLTLFFQGSAGEFSELPTVLMAPNITGPISVATGDFDGDGDLDLVSTSSDSIFESSNLTFYFQTSPGRFSIPPDGPLIHDSIVGPRSVCVRDLDGDGDLDLASANQFSDNLTVLFQEGSGEFPGPSAVLLSTGVYGPRSVAIGDLDADGDLDLVSANVVSDNLMIFFQVSPGQFEADPAGPLTTIASMNGPSSVVAGDLDGDGDLDIVSANAIANELHVFFQSGPGQFTGSPTILTDHVDTPRSVVTGDFDRDGRLDIVCANSGTNDLTVFLQAPQGAFANHSDARLMDSDMIGPRSVAAGDFNGDGHLDLVSANSGSDNFSIFFQKSPGSFTPAVTLKACGSEPRSVVAGDLDGDGDLDLASANFGSDDLTVYCQTSPGVFTVDPAGPLTAPGVIDPRSVVAGDVDGDGDLDLVSANSGSDTLTIFLQTSPGRFRVDPAGELTALSDPRFVVAGDLDGDGDLDLVSANHGSDSLTIFFGSH